MNDADQTKPAIREEKKPQGKVIRGTAKTKKKNEIHKFADIFIAEDVNTVKTFLVEDVLIPGCKKIIYDLFVDGLGMLLNGSTGRKQSRASADYVSYRNYGERRDDRRRDEISRSRQYYNYDDVSFETRGDAEAVLMRMKESIRRYDMVSVFDLYDFAGLPTSPADTKYGWISLRDADISRVNGRYIIRLPRALPLD